MFQGVESFPITGLLFLVALREIVICGQSIVPVENQFVMIDYLLHLSSVGTGKGGTIQFTIAVIFIIRGF